MSHFNRPSPGQVIASTDVSQICDFLEVQSGGSETGKYYIAGGAGASNWTISIWEKFNNRWGTPLSVSLNTSTQAPTGGAATPGTGHLDASGAQFYTITSSAATNAAVGGVYTLSF